MPYRFVFQITCSLVLTFGVGCSVPRPMGVPQVTSINRVPCDPELGKEMGAFLQSHVNGWKSAGSGPVAAPADYILIEGETWRPFTLGYRNTTLVSKRGGGYLTKQVSGSEIERLKGLMARVPSSRMEVPPPPMETAAAPEEWEAPAGGGGAGEVVAAAQPERPAKPAAAAQPAKPAAAGGSATEVDITPAVPKVVESEEVTERKYQFMKKIWPENSTLVPTSRGFDRPGFVYTGVVEEATIQEMKKKYKAEFGDDLLVRKFGS